MMRAATRPRCSAGCPVRTRRDAPSLHRSYQISLLFQVFVAEGCLAVPSPPPAGGRVRVRGVDGLSLRLYPPHPPSLRDGPLPLPPEGRRGALCHVIQAFADRATSNPLKGVHSFLVRLFSRTTVLLGLLHVYAAVCRIVRCPQQYSLQIAAGPDPRARHNEGLNEQFGQLNGSGET